MCYTIIVGLSRPSQEWLKKLPNDVKTWEAYEELSPFMGGASTNVIVKGMCSCALFSPNSYESILKKYHRKGWSEARIERVIAQLSEKRNLFGLDPNLRTWLADVADSVGHVYFLAHWVSDGLNTTQTVDISSAQMRDERTTIKEEHIVRVFK